MKIYFYTFGCKVNQYETDNIRELFLENGHTSVNEYRDADVCVINSCTVTGQADQKCRQLIKKLRREVPDSIIVLAGCFVQAFESKAAYIAECDIVVGTTDKRKIPQLVDEYIRSGEKIVAVKKHSRQDPFEHMTNHGESEKTRAYIKIQDGCDRYCTYCIIPFARGHVRSKSLDVITEEVTQLTASGHKEIVLTGINLCCYGSDIDKTIGLTDAVEAACAVQGDFRVRLSSIEPEMMTDECIERLSRQKKLCAHFHLSLQSGCDATLKRMNRHYTTAEYADLCKRLRQVFPDCSITTDIMVGFPGESEEEFEQSMRFAQEIAFAQAHIFPYSRRSGTSADRMPMQVEKKLKHERAKRMSEICKRTEKYYLRSCVGKTFRVLFERETQPQWHSGHADNYITVKVPRNDETSLRRQFKNVRIISACDGYCIGELTD